MRPINLRTQYPKIVFWNFCISCVIYLNVRRKHFALPNKNVSARGVTTFSRNFNVLLKIRAVVMVTAWVKNVNTNSERENDVKYQSEEKELRALSRVFGLL